MARRRPRTRIFFVSPLGRDDWSGTRPEGCADGTDGPFRTLRRARDAVRTARAEGHRGAATVRLRGGVYRPAETLELIPEDGGADGAPVTWEPYRDELPCLDGGRPVVGWRPAAELPAGAPGAAAGALWVAAVPRGWHFSRLYWNGRPLPRAVSVAEEDWRAWPCCELGDDPDAEVVLPAGALPRGDDCRGADLNYMPTPGTRWSNALAPVVDVDRRRRRLRIVPMRLPRPESTRQIPFRLENLAAGLTGPGRWFLDSEAGRLYLWAPAGEEPERHDVVAPFLTTLLRLRGRAEAPLRRLRLRGLTLRHSRLERPAGRSGFDASSAALEGDGIADCRVEACCFTRLGGWALRAGPAVERCRIRRCRVEEGAAGGFLLAGRNGDGAFPCRRNRIEDNELRALGRLYWHSAGIRLSACAESVVAHNLVREMPYAGIVVGGGARHTYFRGWPRPSPELERLWRAAGEGEPTIDAVKRFVPGRNLVEKNVVHHVMQVLDDGAAIYCHAGHHEALRHNLVYAVQSPFGMGLYFDDEQMDSIMEGNLVYRCPDDPAREGHSAAVHLHHNGRNRVINNILVGGRQVLSVPAGYGGHCLERNILVWTGEPNWERADPAPVEGAGDGRRQGGWSAGPSCADRNLWWSTAGPRAAARLLAAWQVRGYGENSRAVDPRFRDPAGEDFRLAENSPAFAIGIRPLALDDAGPR